MAQATPATESDEKKLEMVHQVVEATKVSLAQLEKTKKQIQAYRKYLKNADGSWKDLNSKQLATDWVAVAQDSFQATLQVGKGLYKLTKGGKYAEIVKNLRRFTKSNAQNALKSIEITENLDVGLNAQDVDGVLEKMESGINEIENDAVEVNPEFREAIDAEDAVNDVNPIEEPAQPPADPPADPVGGEGGEGFEEAGDGLESVAEAGGKFAKFMRFLGFVGAAVGVVFGTMHLIQTVQLGNQVKQTGADVVRWGTEWEKKLNDAEEDAKKKVDKTKTFLTQKKEIKWSDPVQLMTLVTFFTDAQTALSKFKGQIDEAKNELQTIKDRAQFELHQAEENRKKGTEDTILGGIEIVLGTLSLDPVIAVPAVIQTSEGVATIALSNQQIDKLHNDLSAISKDEAILHNHELAYEGMVKSLDKALESVGNGLGKSVGEIKNKLDEVTKLLNEMKNKKGGNV